MVRRGTEDRFVVRNRDKKQQGKYDTRASQGLAFARSWLQVAVGLLADSVAHVAGTVKPAVNGGYYNLYKRSSLYGNKQHNNSKRQAAWNASFSASGRGH